MKVAVIGSGVSGLAVTWALNEHSQHEVHLYEGDSRPGGHANTVSFSSHTGSKKSVNVDTGFIVFNPSSYPNFLSFLDWKGVAYIPTNMTFSVSRDRGAFEWAGTNLSTVFCQLQNIVSLGMWRMIWDVVRFNVCARRFLYDKALSKDGSISIGEFLVNEGFSGEFRDNYLIPMTAAIWSTPPDKCALDFPAATLFRFMHNHHLLQIIGKPSWLTIRNGSHAYVERILAALPAERFLTSRSVVSVSQSIPGASLAVTTADGGTERYDAVVLATHSDTALNILRNGTKGATELEERVLGAFSWSKNEAVLHSDVQLMPTNRAAWSCWNYLTTKENPQGNFQSENCIRNVSLTYSMNQLQHISELEHGPVLVTLNPPFRPRMGTIRGSWTYEHPVITSAALEAQMLLPQIQNQRGIMFCGAWTKYGFHEDGWTSGIRIASEFLGAELPFEIKSPNRAVSQITLFDLSVDVLEFVRRVLSFLLFLSVQLVFTPNLEG